MKNILTFDADENLILCIEKINNDSNSLVIEAKADSFQSPQIEFRNNGGTSTIASFGSDYSYTIPIENWINVAVQTLEVRIRCTDTGDCSEWLLINTPVTDTTKNICVNQISAREFTTAVTSGNDYILPIASETTLGGIKIGSDLHIDSDGVVTVPALGGITIALDAINGEVI